jgi:hypothetical protein
MTTILQPPRALTISSVLSALAVAGALGLAAAPVQASWEFGTKTVTGSGQVTTVKRELASFHEIAVNLHGKIELIQGDSEGIAIEADDNLLPLIETVVKNGELIIRPVKGVNLSGKTKIKVTVNARNIDSLSLTSSAELSAARLQSPKLAGSIAGSGKITIKELQSDDLSVSIAGSGSFEAQGAAKALDVNIAGSGDVSTAKLSTQDAKVSIAGSGDATLWVRKGLSVSIAGSGHVRYYGEGALRDSSTVGSGRVKQLGTTPPV